MLFKKIILSLIVFMLLNTIVIPTLSQISTINDNITSDKSIFEIEKTFNEKTAFTNNGIAYKDMIMIFETSLKEQWISEKAIGFHNQTISDAKDKVSLIWVYNDEKSYYKLSIVGYVEGEKSFNIRFNADSIKYNESCIIFNEHSYFDFSDAMKFFKIIEVSDRYLILQLTVSGKFDIDPIFGDSTPHSTSATLSQRILGEYMLFTGGNNQQLDSMSAYVKKQTANGNINLTYAIYYHANNSLIAQTPCVDTALTTSFQWITINFTTPVTLYNDTEYLLLAWADTQTYLCFLGAYDTVTNATQGHREDLSYTGVYPSSITWDYHNTFSYAVYGNYSAIPNPPVTTTLLYNSSMGYCIFSNNQSVVNNGTSWVTQPNTTIGTLAFIPYGSYTLDHWAIGNNKSYDNPLALISGNEDLNVVLNMITTDMFSTILALIIVLVFFGLTTLMYSKKYELKIYIVITVVFALLVNVLSLAYSIPFAPYFQLFVSLIEVLMLYNSFK